MPRAHNVAATVVGKKAGELVLLCPEPHCGVLFIVQSELHGFTFPKLLRSLNNGLFMGIKSFFSKFNESLDIHRPIMFFGNENGKYFVIVYINSLELLGPEQIFLDGPDDAHITLIESSGEQGKIIFHIDAHDQIYASVHGLKHGQGFVRMIPSTSKAPFLIRGA